MISRWDEVRGRRLERSYLVGRAGAGQLEVVARALCGIQAQVQASAELQLAARIDGLTQSDVREALWERRTLVKTWTVRGTLHLHPAEEVPLWYAARRAVAGDGVAELEAWRDPNGVLHPPLSRDEVTAVRQAVWDALDGRCLLRDELVEETAKHVGPAARGRLRSGFAFFFHEICQGPPRGGKVTFARPDQWIEGWTEVDEQEALLEVCKRFVLTYGPTRAGDFRAWFGGSALTTADAQALFDSLGAELEVIELDGSTRYVAAGDTRLPRHASSVRMIPEYDAYVMGFREREQLVPDPVRQQSLRHGRGRFEGAAAVPLLLVDGVAAGVWTRKKRGKRLELYVTLARDLPRAQRTELDHEAERLGAFLGLQPSLTVDPQ